MTTTLTSRSVIAASAASAMAFAVAAPAAAAPSVGSIDSGSLGQDSSQADTGSATHETLDDVTAPIAGSLGTEPAGSTGDADATEDQAEQNTTPASPQANTYAETPPAPGTFNPDALGELSPQTIGATGAVASAAVGSTILSLGPYGPSTGSALIGGLLPGVTYVPATGSLGSSASGEFTTSVGGIAISENAVFQGALGIGTTILTGYFEGMAKKQDAAELTEEDIELWDGIINSIDELRAVASLPPIERGDPHVQVALPEPCRRGFAEDEDITEDEADELCEQAMAEQEEAQADEDADPDAEDGAVAAGEDEDNADKAVDNTKAVANGDDQSPAERTAGNTSPAGTNAGAQLAGFDANADQRTDEPTAIAAEPRLANTGVDALTLGAGAAALIAVGGAFVFLGRRRAND